MDWRDRSGFRADPDEARASRPSRRQTIALLAVLALVSGAVALVSYLVQPQKARAFDLFHGSVFLGDQHGPVAVDLATGKPSLQISGADKQVGIDSEDQQLAVVPLVDRTLLLNQSTGEFNMVDNSGFVVKRTGGGVPLTPRAGQSSSVGIASRTGQAYIVRTGPTGGTDVYLVSQSTVESAINATGNVMPRASGAVNESVNTAPGAAAGANGDLWLLAGRPDGMRVIRQLSVPVGSSAGATLVSTPHRPVNGPAAIGTATNSAGADVVGVASRSGIDLFAPGAKPVHATYAPPAGVDKILPTSNGTGRLAFLMHGSDGWYITSVNADGTALLAPHLVDALPNTPDLAAPAASNGRLYTINESNGDLYRIGYDGSAGRLPGVPTYPIPVVHHHQAELAAFHDAYVIARGPRVIFNSASHDDAVMVFTDGSRGPRTIVKSSAIPVNAANGADALTRSTVPPGHAGKSQGGKPKPAQALQPVNNKINCKTAKQRPHVPVITGITPGSRSVTLNWSYPIISPQDCYPSTYVVSFKLLSADAPQPPGSVRVDSQTGATIGGLFPSSRYAVTVTAYINGQGTDSATSEFPTGAEGPAAPTNLQVRADSSGNWKLSWDSCGTVEQGCVAAQSWTITPSFCDGRGVSSPPEPITVTGDPTSKRQPPATYPSSDDLLGRGLQFQVQGTGDQGQAGTPSDKSACIYSWTPPVAADLSVQASSPPPTAGSEATTATVATVSFDKGQIHDLGGVDGTLTYELLKGGSVVDRVGPTTKPSVKLQGIRAAENYQVRVLASPPRHPKVVVPIGPVPVQPAVANWPQLLVSNPTIQEPPGINGTLHVSFSLGGADTRGETFDLVNSRLSCGGGNAVMPLNASDVVPGDDMTFDVDRRQYNGPCTVTIQLAQDSRTATDPPLYGAGSMSKSVTSSPFQIDPPSVTSSKNDFHAQWGPSETDPTVVVSYTGGDDLSGASGWRLVVTNGNTANCNRSGDPVADPPPVTISVSRACVSEGGNFSVSIDYNYFIIRHAHFDVDVQGQAPKPVDPSRISFTDVKWDPDPDLTQVDATYNGSESLDQLAPLNWTEVVTSNGVTCGTNNDNPAAHPNTQMIRVKVDLTTCPPTGSDGTAATYTIEISFTDPNYGQSGDYKYTVSGTPPQ